MTWEIALGIIALFGFVFTCALNWGKLTKTLASLQTTLQALKETLEDLKENNRASHKEFYEKLDDHGRRIGILEEKHKHD